VATYLLVGIDTDGDDVPAEDASGTQTFQSVCALPGLHALFERCAVRPTYLASWPVASDERSQEVLRFLHLRGHCEIGAHHRAWETPPCPPATSGARPMACTLTVERFEAQLAELTAAIARVIGDPPVSYRSARCGLDAVHVGVLERYGYLVDSSVETLRTRAQRDDPDFARAPLAPYFLSYDSLVRPGTSRLLEIPCAAALDREVSPALEAAYARAPWPAVTRRALRMTGVARVESLDPSRSTFDAMTTLARRLVVRGVPVLNVHLSCRSAVPEDGGPDTFLGGLERFLRVATEELGARPVTFRELHAAYTAPPPVSPGPG
jgi:hypothetical protein